MSKVSIMPIAGMNTVGEDAALQVGGKAPKTFLRDAVNVDVTPAGKVQMRGIAHRVTDKPLRHLWQSPLHGDVFGVLDGEWVKVDPATWDTEVLATIGEGDVSHEVVNNLVMVAGPTGIFLYDGTNARRLAIDTPAAPFVMNGSGSLESGRYGVSVAFLRGLVESPTSPIYFIDLDGDGGALVVNFPVCLDQTVTGIRVYLTQRDGGQLGFAGQYPIDQPSVTYPLMPAAGRVPPFRHREPMPTGQFLKFWRGRLLTSKGNVLRFSDPLAFHIHDDQHSFVQMPQRITFIQPVDGGIWVGQRDHVAFLAGTSPDDLSRVRKASRTPVPGSCIPVDADLIGNNASQGGSMSAMWLAENGYVIGTASGQIIELHAGVLSGITGKASTSVVVDQRVLTSVL